MSRPQSLMAWNTFKLCTGLRVIGSLMIVVVLAIIGVSYYAIVIVNYGPELLKGGSSLALSFFVLIAFHGLLAMVLWSYFVVSFTDPGSVPKSWSPVTDDEDTEAQIMPLATTTISSSIGAAMNMEEGSMVNATDHNSQVRWCRKCNHYKPLRCHHCSVCGSCVLKMDHHCVWIANCVGARNYKFFLLFLIYTFLETALDTIALLPHFILFFKDIDQISGSAAGLASTFIAFILNLAFALSLLGFLIMHASLVASNTTTIEAYEKKRSSRWRYDLGRNQNFEQVFGTRKWYWLVPIYSSEDLRSMPVLQGLDYPVRSDIEGLD